MADVEKQTTSSTSLEEKENEKPACGMSLKPKGDAAADGDILTRLSPKLDESYQMIKRRQQQFNELNARLAAQQMAQQTAAKAMETLSPDTDWQEVGESKKKLKRKKQLSASLTSVSDSVNQEKRTRIEGIQLNCRGKLRPSDMNAFTQSNACTPVQGINAQTKIFSQRPPAPTPIIKVEKPVVVGGITTTMPVTVPPPRLKRKLQENVQTIQKLNALTDQLRLELNELKSSLITERGAVRSLRAQNESESRKWKTEVKKLQQRLEVMQKSQTAPAANKPNEKLPSEIVVPNLPQAAAGSLVNYEIQRLTNEINILKEANKTLEEKKVINCDADRRKAADMRTLKDSYEIRLTQLQKSAKIEITRLLEEIKTKERNIGQLKKDLQILQNDKSKGKIATTKNQTNKTKATTTTNTTTSKKPKKPIKNISINKNNNTTKTDIADTMQEVSARTKDLNAAQLTDEMTKLKDIELIKNTKNNHNNNNNNIKNNNIHRSTEILTNTQNKEYHSLPHDISYCQRNKATTITTAAAAAEATTTTTTTTEIEPQQTHELHNDHQHGHHGHEREHDHHHHHHHEFRTTAKDNNSDSDSALSSAPPSISPQPPPAGMDSTDIWQTIRTYAQDIEKLQKEIDSLHKQNERLQNELTMAKEQILANEQSALEAANNAKLKELIERIKAMEEQEHQLQSEANELREQNELLEFRILELEDNNDKWSLQSNTLPSSASSTTHTNTMPTVAPASAKDVWACGEATTKDDPLQMLFGNSSLTMDSGITSPHGDEEPNLEDTLEELCRRLRTLLNKTTIDDSDKHCLQQLLNLMQQIELNTLRSGPASLNASHASSDEPSSMELVKSRASDYSSSSGTTATTAATPTTTSGNNNSSSNSGVRPVSEATNSLCKQQQQQQQQQSNSKTTIVHPRIVATVQPYNSSSCVPTNTPNDSPRKQRLAWQCNSLSESGVFVDSESDFLGSESVSVGSGSEKHASTQTEFEDFGVDDEDDDDGVEEAQGAGDFSTVNQRLQRVHSTPAGRVTCHAGHATLKCTYSSQLPTSELKRLQYYKERLALLEGKVLIYESTGGVQAKHLADRLQREIQLEKQLKELADRVELLEGENSTLEEEKCEFEEAENDTRLRLQRLEVELEILTQRNVELELSKEALSAKYKDCRTESLILREDLAVCETQIQNLEADKQQAKRQLEILQKSASYFLVYRILNAVSPLLKQQQEINARMGNELSIENKRSTGGFCSSGHKRETKSEERQSSFHQSSIDDGKRNDTCARHVSACGNDREMNYLKGEVQSLRTQIKDLNSRHYEAMETADSHWVDLEREHKQREEAYRAKEVSLKQKISKLQECLRDDSRAANEKIQQLEETEKGLKTCLVRISKEHRELLEEHNCMLKQLECYKEQRETFQDQQKPLVEALESERRRSKNLIDELTFVGKLQQTNEDQFKKEAEDLRKQIFDMRKEYMHIEVTNSELKEEVNTLETKIGELQTLVKEHEEKERVLKDELLTKDDLFQQMEHQRNERTVGHSLAEELCDTPSKRFRREEVKDLKTASMGLGNVLRNLERCERDLPTHTQFHTVARDVKRLADSILREKGDEVSENENAVEEVQQSASDATEERGSSTRNVGGGGNVPMLNLDIMKGLHNRSPKSNSANRSLTVGMALISNVQVDENLKPTSTTKSICEVPSAMRKLSSSSKGVAPTLTTSSNVEEIEKSKTLRRRRRSLKRFFYKRIIHGHMRRTISTFGNQAQNEALFDTSDLQFHKTEVLQKRFSFTSFHSVPSVHSVQLVYSLIECPNIDHASYTEMPLVATLAVHAFCQTEGVPMKSVALEAKPQTFEQAILAKVESVASAIQVDDELTVSQRLDLLPENSFNFVRMLENSVTEATWNAKAFQCRFMRHWETNKSFRKYLEELHGFWVNDSTQCESPQLDDYEKFVAAIRCLEELKDIFKPLKLSLLSSIEEQLHERLLVFHNNKVESEFYCTIYYPVARPVPIIIQSKEQATENV